jgi:Kinesin motor domain
MGVSNMDIYQSMVKRVTISALEGINGTVFVYGQTGSGKTYTMLGKDRMPSMKRRQSMTPHSTFDNSRLSNLTPC